MRSAVKILTIKIVLKDKVKIFFCQIQLSNWVEIKSSEKFLKPPDNETLRRGIILHSDSRNTLKK